MVGHARLDNLAQQVYYYAILECGLLPKIKNFNFPGLKMMANAHVVPPPRRLYVLLDCHLEMLLTLCGIAI